MLNRIKTPPPYIPSTLKHICDAGVSPPPPSLKHGFVYYFQQAQLHKSHSYFALYTQVSEPSEEAVRCVHHEPGWLHS